ncbi:hypothetical protein WR25_08692 isoform B [Diploscapter pachys]|uniref:C-type lectin domain-containing protein n=1 Tax=Diploscapter pachys TaxID=2018661 RepID=A0A2A2L1Y6_9BILA|nr:hypothetical protein WR25_08692 isoform B [Diploscapter pachys]
MHFRCYRFFNDPSNFLTADSYCRMYGYTLASIHSMFENNFIQKQAGLSLSMTYQSFFIGLYSSSMKTENYNWTWTDETPYDFWNWLSGDPTGTKWCAAMRISDGKWHNVPCESKLPFVCSAPPGNPGNVTTNPPPTTQPRTTTTPRPLITTTEKHNCPRNWGFFPTTYDCYLLKPYYTLNNPDNQYCNGTIRSIEENGYVRDFAAGFFAGLQVCFTGSTDNEMYLIGEAGIIGLI